MNSEDVLSLMRRVADSKSALSQHGIVSPVNQDQVISDEQAEALQNVKTELKNVVFQLESEMAARFQLDAALQHEREMLFPSKHAKVMQLRDVEVRELESQRDTMSAWLRRGVKEAERAATELIEIQSIHSTTKAAQEEALRENDELGAVIRQLENEFTERSAQVESLDGERNTMRDQVINYDENLKELHSNVEASSYSSTAYTADRVFLKTNARRMELIEVAVSCIAACARRAEHNLKNVQYALSNGNADIVDPAEDDGFDSEAEATPSSFPPKVAAVVKPLLQDISRLTTVVNQQVQTFATEQGRREKERMEMHVRELAAIRASNAQTRQECDEQIYGDSVIANEMEQEREELLSFLREQQEATIEALEYLGQSPPKRKAPRDESPQNSSFANASFANASFVKDFDAETNDDTESNYTAFTRKTTRSLAPQGVDVRPKKLSVFEQLHEIIAAIKADAIVLEKSNAKWKDKVGSQEEDYASVKKLRNTYRDLDSKKTMLSIEIREAEELNKELKFAILDYSDVYSH